MHAEPATEELKSIALESIHAIPDKVFNDAQRNAWIKAIRETDWKERLARQELFLDWDRNTITGFLSLDGDYIDFLYVRPRYQGKGVATKLLNECEASARKSQDRLTVRASPLLFPILVKRGFEVTQPEELTLHGIDLRRYRMVKPFGNTRHTSRVLFQTERLLLREMLPIDAETCYELNLQPEVMQFTGDVPFDSIEASRQFLENYDPYKKEGLGRWAVILKEEGKFAGWCGLKRRDDGNVDLGYRFHHHYWNQGYATEASRFAIQYAREKALDELILETHEDNKASQRVAEKLGFKFERELAFENYTDYLYILKLNAD